jgi:peptidoglycan hydrolase CwlO-like protein
MRIPALIIAISLSGCTTPYIEETLSEHDARISETETKLEELQMSIAKLHTDLLDGVAQIESLKVKATAQAAKVEELRARIEELENQPGELPPEVVQTMEDLKRGLQELEAIIDAAPEEPPVEE